MSFLSSPASSPVSCQVSTLALSSASVVSLDYPGGFVFSVFFVIPGIIPSEFSGVVPRYCGAKNPKTIPGITVHKTQRLSSAITTWYETQRQFSTLRRTILSPPPKTAYHQKRRIGEGRKLVGRWGRGEGKE